MYLAILRTDATDGFKNIPMAPLFPTATSKEYPEQFNFGLET